MMPGQLLDGGRVVDADRERLRAGAERERLIATSHTTAALSRTWFVVSSQAAARSTSWESFAALDRIGYDGTITFESFSSAVVSPALTRALCIRRATRRSVVERLAAAAA